MCSISLTTITYYRQGVAAPTAAIAAMASSSSSSTSTAAEAEATEQRIVLPSSSSSEILPSGQAVPEMVASKLEGGVLQQPPVLGAAAAAKGVGVTVDSSAWPIVHGSRASADHTVLRQPHGDPRERFYLFNSQVLCM